MKRRTSLALALAAALATPAAALAAAAPAPPRVLADCVHQRVKPSRIVLACGDGGEILKALKWSRWKATRASGAGTDYVNDCKPDCASGHVKSYPATVTLSKPVACHGHAMFTHAVVRFPKAHPFPKRTETDLLICPP